MRTVTAGRVTIGTCAALFALSVAAADEPPEAYAYPIFGYPFSCMEHWEGNLKGIGDALGSDCMIQDFVDFDGRVWSRPYSGDGTENEQWFGWGKDVLSPCICTVVELHDNPKVNKPGVLGDARSASITLRRGDGVQFLLAHVTDFRVKVNDNVQAGQVIARVGNNGFARNPHVHIAAWRGDTPLQIRFDLAALGKLIEK